MNDVKAKVQEIFRIVFDDEDLEVEEESTADDIDDWDSLEHINLIIAVENKFSIKFATSEISQLKLPDQNVGTFIELIKSKLV